MRASLLCSTLDSYGFRIMQDISKQGNEQIEIVSPLHIFFERVASQSIRTLPFKRKNQYPFFQYVIRVFFFNIECNSQVILLNNPNFFSLV